MKHIRSRAFAWYFGTAWIYLDLMLLPAIVGCSFVHGTHDYDAVGTWTIAFTIAAFFIGWYIVLLADNTNEVKRAEQLNVLAAYGRHVFMCYTPIGWLLSLSELFRERVGLPIAHFLWTHRA
ncbi:MAG: hypothetical protein WCT41_03655 [Candidatus Paceibacterota bacterium]|jgi:hypothetical protein